MAYTLEAQPLPLNISTTLLPEPVLTPWEEFLAWISDERNLAQYILIPGLCLLYGGCLLLYIIHRLRKMYKKNKRRRRAEEKEASLEKQPILDDEKSGSDSPYVSQIVREPVSLTYHSSEDRPERPLNDENLYPVADRQNLYPPKPTNAQRGPSPTKSMTTIKKTVIPATKPKTQIVVRCRCAGTMHSPGCPQFSLPAPITPTNTDSMRASASDVSIALREAMDKVSVYEHELKTNPSMKALLAKYRQLKTEKKKQTWDEHAKKGDWTKVPIAQLLERKRQMRRDNPMDD